MAGSSGHGVADEAQEEEERRTGDAAGAAGAGAGAGAGAAAGVAIAAAAELRVSERFLSIGGTLAAVENVAHQRLPVRESNTPLQ